MKTQNILLRLLPLRLFSQYLTAQSIGIKTITPLASLDINRSVAMRKVPPQYSQWYEQRYDDRLYWFLSQHDADLFIKVYAI